MQITNAQLNSDSIRHPLVDNSPPPWASAWGEDKYGIFAEFTVPVTTGSSVTQRLRWLPAGTFTMGSPEDEPGRYPDEGPQREVTISKPFWMFATPCTQALWTAVMGENPSTFRHDQRPVENVSWDDAVQFIEKLNESVGALFLQLPTEAQWEYACRAGTTEATYAGPIELLGENHAPILDDIAWYGGNSGVDFELENGVDSSYWSEKQYDHQTAGTRIVGQKDPNRWGLFDTLGDVLEWCHDLWSDDYVAAETVDPSGPAGGHKRVLRGGSWNDVAQSVRSAYRDGLGPGLRDYYVGFRCAQVQEPSQ